MFHYDCKGWKGTHQWNFRKNENERTSKLKMVERVMNSNLIKLEKKKDKENKKRK